MLRISARLIAEEAVRRGWKVEPLDERFISTLAIITPDGRTHSRRFSSANCWLK